MAWLELFAGNLRAARRLANESLAIRRQLGTRLEVGISQTLLGEIALAAGEPHVAAAHFAEGLTVHRDVGNRWGMALGFEGVASLVAATQPEAALCLAGAAHALRTVIGRPLPQVAQLQVSNWLERARRAVVGACAQRKWTDGLTMGEARASTMALELATAFTRYRQSDGYPAETAASGSHQSLPVRS
jgi:hypothetical protein